MHAPVRPPSPINQPSGRNEAHSINTTTSPDDARGLLRLPRPSSKIARGGQQPPVLLPHEQARPVHVRPAAPRPTGVPPSPNSLSKGTVALVVRGSGQGAGDDRSSRSATTRAGPILNRACSAAQVSDRRAPLMAGSVGRGARPMVRVETLTLTTQCVCVERRVLLHGASSCRIGVPDLICTVVFIRVEPDV